MKKIVVTKTPVNFLGKGRTVRLSFRSVCERCSEVLEKGKPCKCERDASR